MKALLKKQTRRDSLGFSLLELLIYIGLICILSVVLVNLFVTVNFGRGNIESRSEVDSNVRLAMEKIEQDLHAATAVATPATAGATSTVLTLAIGTSTITYDVAAGQLRRQVNTSTPDTITSDKVVVNVTDDPLIFTRFENTNSTFTPPKIAVSISVKLNIKYKTSSPNWQYNETKKTTVLLR